MSAVDSTASLPSVWLESLIPSPEAVACLPEPIARRLLCVPIAKYDNKSTLENELLIASVEPEDVNLQERLMRQLPPRLGVKYIVAEEAAIRRALEKCYDSKLQGRALLEACEITSQDTVAQLSGNNTIARLVEALLLHAYRERASDIHLSHHSAGVRIRFRIDGVLGGQILLRKAFHTELVGRIKILAHMDIAEARQPQDGQFVQFIDNELVDFRASAFPTINGENIVIRVLRPSQLLCGLESLKLPDHLRLKLLSCLHKPSGLIVFCGPTGSGKSTSMHTLLSELDAESLNIMTLEDPVEKVSPSIQQTSIDDARSLGYAEALRALMRQDPDVLLIGEVRDSTSCQMVLRAVMTGHSVLTTVHASTAIGAIDRIIDLGANRSMLASHLLCIAAQRLIRKLCHQCSGLHTDCMVCHGSGFHGRQAVVELLVITPPIAALISAAAEHQIILNEARRSGFVSLQEQAASLVNQGLSTKNEMHRVLGG